MASSTVTTTTRNSTMRDAFVAAYLRENIDPSTKLGAHVKRRLMNGYGTKRVVTARHK